MSVLLLILLSVNIEGNKRREKPSRWKEAVDNEIKILTPSRVTLKSGLLSYYDPVVYYPLTFKFAYSPQYDESCDCQKNFPSLVSRAHSDVETLQPSSIPLMLYLEILKKKIFFLKNTESDPKRKCLLRS